jgi:hypothetical protein
MQGIYALSQRLEELIDLKIAITGGVHFDLVKRVRQTSTCLFSCSTVLTF